MEPVPLLPDDEASIKGTRDWPHAPPHRLQNAGVYFLTSRALGGRHLLQEPDMRDWFQDLLLALAADFGWKLEAWAILSNHYHLIGHSPVEGGQTLKKTITKLHSFATKERNRPMAQLPGNRLDPPEQLPRPAALRAPECRAPWFGAGRLAVEMGQRGKVQGGGVAGLGEDDHELRL
jgi:hypothetical protein